MLDDDDFVTDPDGFKLTLRPRRASKPPASGSSPTPPLSKWEFTVVWLGLLTLHGLCAAFLLAKARLYWFLENPLMAYYTNLLALPKQRYFRLFGTVAGVLGALHALQLLLHLYTSIRARVPMVWPRAAMVARLVKSPRKLKKKVMKTTPAPSVTAARTASRTASSYQSFQRTMSGLQEVLSVEGKYFALVFMLRKAVEVSAQIVQCHRFSFLIAREWINRVVTPAADALDHLQNDAVTAIVFEHCVAFEMPPSIRRFPSLLGLELWNVMVVSWGPEAALNAVLHPKMIYLVMVYVNMTEMPQGLLQSPLPELLGDIEMSCTNLTKIPAELAEAWANVRLVYLEQTPLLEFLTPLFQIPSLSVSLLNDGLTTVPDDLFTSIVLLDEFLEIALSYNPITTLPDAARENLIINYLSVDHTELSTLPAWTGDVVDQWLNLGGAPMCNKSDPELSDITSCYDGGWDPIIDGRYPLYLVAPFREL